METRQGIKAVARQRLSENYWLCVGVIALVVFCVSAISGVLSFVTGILGFEMVGSIIGCLLWLPAIIALNYFSVSIYRGENPCPTIDDVFNAGFSDFGRKMAAMLWMELFATLWTLLLIVPGIIKGIAYSFVPYILTDFPEVSPRDALKLSMQLTDGHKWEIFMMSLSLFGWFLLSVFTFGIVGLFYVNPYFHLSMAGLYNEIKETANIDAVIDFSEIA